MADECWEAGHGGDYEADHVFNDAVEGGVVSDGCNWEFFREWAYLSSVKIMTMMV